MHSIIQPFIPHVSEEIWSAIGNKVLCINQEWPKIKTVDDVSNFKVVVQVNGKNRGLFEFEEGTTKKKIIEIIKGDDKIMKYVEGKKILREIYVPKKIFNLVI